MPDEHDWTSDRSSLSFKYRERLGQAIFQILRTSPSEMSKRAVLTAPHDTVVVGGVAAVTTSEHVE